MKTAIYNATKINLIFTIKILSKFDLIIQFIFFCGLFKKSNIDFDDSYI